MISKLNQVIKCFPCLSSIEAKEWNRTDISIVQVPTTPVAFARGHRLHHAIFILDGCVRIYRIGENGREITLYRVQSGGVCLMMIASILGDLDYEAFAAVESDVEALIIPAETFRNWIHTYDSLSRFIYGLFIRKMSTVTQLVEEIAFKGIDDRIADYLIKHTSLYSDEIIITHEKLSIELGTAREVVSRTLKKFEKEGLLTLHRGKIVNIQRKALQQKFSRFL
ncbi:Crp/Fnr family transcriptional regulator [Bacillus sp. S13(2024)]|uniref:Crp/Fnr family transcriptional regulator n=1 Tax=unclassified Bacillus (in: firmicutes) TaxID=185979 RepID=UPI003D1F9928